METLKNNVTMNGDSVTVALKFRALTPLISEEMYEWRRKTLIIINSVIYTAIQHNNYTIEMPPINYGDDTITFIISIKDTLTMDNITAIINSIVDLMRQNTIADVTWAHVPFEMC